MKPADFKPITEKQVGLTDEEVKYLVTGAQKYLPPEDEDRDTIDDTGN